MEYVTLNNGVKMPQIGFGVFQIVDPKECEKAVLSALESGYRMIDTASAYANEEAVGNAINMCGVPRDELFLTTKIWISNVGYEKAKKAMEESLSRMQTDYIDLMLIHQPFGDYYGAYRAMEEAYNEGWLRAIGVSNFYPDRLVDLCNYVDILPAVNQIETHVFQQQKTARNYMQKYSVQPEAWAPFAEGRKDLFTNPVLHEIADKYGRSVAQVALRYLIENGIVAIPKTVDKKQMKENFNVFNFQLDADDKAKISSIDEGKSAFFLHNAPFLWNI